MRHQNIKQKRFPLTWPKIIGLLLLILLLVCGVWFVWIRDDRPATSPTSRLQDDGINYDPPTEDEKKEAERQKEEVIKEEEDPPANQALSVTIVRAFQDPGGANVRTLIGGTTSGECHIELSKSGQPTIVKTFPVVFEATNANCQNTPIALADFPVGGMWEIKVTAHKDGSQSPPASTSINIVK